MTALCVVKICHLFTMNTNLKLFVRNHKSIVMLTVARCWMTNIHVNYYTNRTSLMSNVDTLSLEFTKLRMCPGQIKRLSTFQG